MKERTCEIAYRMYVDENKSVEEIAEALGVKAITIKSYLNKSHALITYKKERQQYKTYQQIKAESEKFQQEHGIRWGDKYIKIDEGWRK